MAISDIDLERANNIYSSIRPKFGAGVKPTLGGQYARDFAKTFFTGGGRWQKCRQPFQHFTANNVFDDQTYKALCVEFTKIQEATHGIGDSRYKMRPASGSNDGLILGLTNTLGKSFSPLFTESFLKSLAKLLKIGFIPRVEGALHSNPIGCRTGWIHTDCCSAWFDESNGTPELMFPPRRRCHYFTGEVKAADAKPKEYIRSATLIYYLCNDDWQPEDGGETGLFSHEYDYECTDVKLIPPANNSLLLFECSPHSYHRFQSNPGRVRNSIILWLHSTVEDAEARWGQGINRRGHK